MLREEGIVISTHEYRAMVTTRRGDACSACSAKGACHAMGGGKEMEVEALNSAHASVGDRVELSLPESSVLTASVLVYLVPVVALIVGAMFGQSMAPAWGLSKESGAVILGVASFALAFYIVRLVGAKLGAGDKYYPTITKVLPAEEPPKCSV